MLYANTYVNKPEIFWLNFWQIFQRHKSLGPKQVDAPI